MLWEKPWRPDLVLLLAGGVVLSFFLVNLGAELLGHFGVAGFRSPESAGRVLAATLSFHGAAIVAGIAFLKVHDIRWRDAMGLRGDNWKLQALLAVTMVAAILPVIFGLKVFSEFLLHKMHWTVEEQNAVEMFSGLKSGWLRAYFCFFTVVIAPVGEEFAFRGLLFSASKKLGLPGVGWFGVSLLFAFIHFNPPIFLSLFVLALMLTWLYEKTGGLFAPIVAHSSFNALNLGLLFLAQHSSHVRP
jgi:membrane protease YdiL (CAAX protease family)